MSVVDLEAFHKRADTAEEDIAFLKNKLTLLEESLAGNACNSFQKCGVSREEYLKLQTENTQLKHRIAILLRTVRDERAKHKSLTTMSEPDSTIKRSMPSVCGILRNIFQTAINCAYPNLINPHVDITSTDNPIFGDYQCNSAMSLSKQISSGTKVNCRDVAKNIVTHIKNCLLIEKVEIAGPGFINVFISRSYVASILSDVIQAGEITPPLVNKLKVIVDFSSPNIAKEMHVGHLRSTIIGDSIARLLEYLGHDVLRLNHVGDWGTQFGMLIAHLQDKFPDYLSISPPISDLQSFYKESKARFDAEPDFKKRAYNCVVKLQSHDSNMIKAWQLICDVSRKEFAKVYNRLNIKIIERGESFYQTKMESLVKELLTTGLLEEDEGRKIMWASIPPSGVPLTIVKSDGGFTYDTSDLAAIKQRIEEENAQWIIYVTDAGQSLHFHTIAECAKRVGILTNQRIDHVGFGVVLGEDKKKFKTRSGDTVKLSELLDEGLKRANATIVEKGRDKVLSTEELKLAQEAVAYGCIKYADLSHNRNHEYVFSFDKMLEDKGNTAVYLLYALTRIKSIARIANISKLELQKLACQNPISLDHEKEFKLAKILVKFPDVLLKIANDLHLNHLCDYCFNVACTFAEFYDSCYCVEKNKEGEITKVNVGRILLVEATEMILEKCFFILGLTSVARM